MTGAEIGRSPTLLRPPTPNHVRGEPLRVECWVAVKGHGIKLSRQPGVTALGYSLREDQGLGIPLRWATLPFAKTDAQGAQDEASEGRHHGCEGCLR